jgi:DNA-binding GntR family transcriptional regulator
MEKDSARHFIETISLSDHVRNYLLEALMSGRLRPGGRINEAELSRILGISRNPIREAISGLAQRGYLVSVPRRGHCMRMLTVQDVNDVFSFRICVETFAIQQALPRMTEADLGDLKKILARMIAGAGAGDVTEVRQGDLAFHRRICELSGNRQTLRAHEAIDTEVQMLIACVALEHESLMETALIHVPIVEALQTRDIARSVAAMEHHIRATWAEVLRVYEEIEFLTSGAERASA